MMMMNPLAPSTLLPAAKASGRCPPSLIRNQSIIEGGVFEMAMLRALDRASQGLTLSPEPNASENFTSAMKMASGSSDASTLEQRRCLLLAAVGSTAEKMPSNRTLQNLLKAGLLSTVKAWLDDILTSKVGGIDLLLHLLSNIIPLPVTKEMVTTSRLGKTVSSVEKHRICVGSANEAAIKSRIQQVKERWSASVKALKNNSSKNANNAKNSNNSNIANNVSTKRAHEERAPQPAKKAKLGGSSLSNLLRKVETTNNVVESSTMSAEEERQKKQEHDAKLKERSSTSNANMAELKVDMGARPKKEARRIHWADSSGQALAVSNEGKSDDVPKKAETARQSRWSERKKKDIQHEKELLLQSRNAVSVDDDKEDMLNAMAMMAMWKTPQPLAGIEPPPVPVKSNEINVQTNRMNTTAAVRYSSENEVPISPTLLSEVEKALELSSHNTSTPNVIPFFTPQAAPNPAVYGSAVSNVTAALPPQAQPSVNSSSEATLETVLMMGLPLFLVGSNIQALQTLAANPGLLASFKDINGVYKQPELISLVQTLTQNVAPQASQPNQVQGYAPTTNVYGTANTAYTAPSHVQTAYSQPQPAQQANARGSGYRGDQNVGDANLHLSGYGPSTTNEEIIAMFAPYVHVVEVVNKNGFSFVNTNDAEAAKRAREALSGSLLGGLPCRINPATRKARNPNFTGGAAPAAAGGGADTLPRNSLGQVDYSQVKDDRGNPATKNLFVAGYGPGTTEQQIKDYFGQYATVVSVIMKGTFSFVNTADRDAAVVARSSLSGQQLNGGSLRINFAKETGRLGTSFDSTYGPASASTYGRY
eukprot:CAMPEP_0183747954 /NCGR_PEP_ID=MMETSP0737-20130205/67521_1 /TAXON_ID=385413 /ORGANISM="Thalassiosira miniscula, Strain CCMP1093" /LENGTH=819 /DNA_ID=CAMNT_0025983671 /DNA_START=1075 /DNA_END=3534 /DNA_ORIENTATION=+